MGARDKKASHLDLGVVQIILHVVVLQILGEDDVVHLSTATYDCRLDVELTRGGHGDVHVAVAH